jgi:hypothetical protein
METALEYFLIISLQGVGILLSILHKCKEIDDLNDGDTFRDVWRMFWLRDRITVLISIVVTFLHLLIHVILDVYSDIPKTVPHYNLWDFGLALVMGYGGQRLIYKYLGKAELFLGKKVGDRLS